MRRIEIDEYKRIVVSILVRIDRICRENNLAYCLAYGTLIGAIRHNGFIPWDDDADITMFRNDYVRLREIINHGDYGLRFIDITTDDDTIYPFGKICDVRTHLKEKNFKEVKNYGAFVDVFPLDYLPADDEKRKKYCKKARRKMILLTHSVRTGYGKTGSRIKVMKKAFAFHFCKFLNSKKLIKQMDNTFLENDKCTTEYVGIPWAWGGYSFKKSVFEDVVEHEFEGFPMLIPKEYDYVLRWRYGDYMKLPPESERINSHYLECYIDD